jgi:phosphoenolpyruvate-protein phosphotransferase
MEFTFTFPLAAGLHARPASLLEEEAARWNADVLFLNNTRGTTADAKSTFALLSTLTRAGDACQLRVGGEDEAKAYEALRSFVQRVLPHCDDGMALPAERPEPTGPRPRALQGVPALTGVPVSAGVGIGTAVLVESVSAPDAGGSGPPRSVAEETAKFSAAVRSVAAELETRRRDAASRTGSGILRAHLSLVRDKEFAARVHAYIAEHSCTAGEAVRVVSSRFAETLLGSHSTYLEERAADIRDIVSRLLRAMEGAPGASTVPILHGDAVCVAESLSPSEFLSLDRRFLRGLVLERGETTSHTVILARTEGIPCVTGVKNALRRVRGDVSLIVDGFRGLVFTDPPSDARLFLETEQKQVRRRASLAGRVQASVGKNADGKTLEIGANCSSVADAEAAWRNGADGIGVVRTEIVFAGTEEPPGEDHQVELYTAIMKNAAGRPVIFRTFDVGGDKPVRWLPVPREDNPFLGYRALRMYKDYPDIIETQLRALLRAAAHGEARIMFPMVTSPGEVREWRQQVRRCASSLAAQGVAHAPEVPVGVMIEVPSAVLSMDHLCAEADFFSVGSNDLTQYLLAVDRGNERVGHLYSSFHPALLRSLRMVVEEAHKRERWVGICGEMAGVDVALPLFVGLGFDEISVVPALIPRLKSLLRRYRSDACESLAREALREEDAEDAEALLRGFIGRPGVLGLIDEDLVELASAACSKAEVIRELLGMLEDEGRITDIDVVDEAVWQREDSFSTGMEYAIALPHCKSAGVLTPSVAIARLARPVEWNAGESTVSTVILIAVPEDSATEVHLKIIASLARSLMHEEFRTALFEMPSREGIVDLVLSRTGRKAAGSKQ